MAERNRGDRLRLTSSSKLSIEKTIGSGRYGVVKKAKHVDWGVVAVKELTQGLEIPENVIFKLQAEADKLYHIGHPNVIKILGLITEPARYGMVLEYMANGCLEDFLDHNSLKVSWALKARMTFEIILGMNYLHQSNPAIIHRDLKGQNILVDSNFHIRISDFGISQWKTYSKTCTMKFDNKRCLKGTVTHIPPENWTNVNLKANVKFDVYSFGILLWELLTEAKPFCEAQTDEQIRSCVVSGQRPDVAEVPADAPYFLCDMMRDCWHPEPKDRPFFADLKIIMDIRYVGQELEQKAREDEVKLLAAQLPRRPAAVAGSSLDSQVEVDAITRQTAALAIRRPDLAQPSPDLDEQSALLTSHTENPALAFRLPVPDGGPTVNVNPDAVNGGKPIQRQTPTMPENTDFGGNVEARRERIAEEEACYRQPHVQRSEDTVEAATDYQLLGRPTIVPDNSGDIQRGSAEGNRNYVSGSGQHRQPAPYTANQNAPITGHQHSQPAPNTANQNAPTTGHQHSQPAPNTANQNAPITGHQHSQPAPYTANQNAATTGHQQSQPATNTANQNAATTASARPPQASGAQRSAAQSGQNLSSLPEDVTTDAATMDLDTDAIPPKEPHPSLYKPESSEGAHSSYTNVASGAPYGDQATGDWGGNVPNRSEHGAARGPPYDPAKGLYPTGPDQFPGQHVPDADGRGYLYYPMPNMAPIHINVPPHPAALSQPNPLASGGVNTKPQVIHSNKKGSSTTIFNLTGNESVQIGDHNVMTVVSGNKKLKSTATRPKNNKNTIHITDSVRKITDGDARVVALHLGRDWKMLARELDIPEGQIDAINHDYNTDGLVEKIYQMLRLWRSLKGNAATVKCLVSKLLLLRRPDVAAKIPKD